jgi:hypothetical protein
VTFRLAAQYFNRYTIACPTVFNNIKHKKKLRKGIPDYPYEGNES